MKKRLPPTLRVEDTVVRDLTYFPKPTINHQSIASLARKKNLKKYRDTIESLGGDGIQFFSDIRGNKGFWFFSENCPMLFQQGYYAHTTVPVFRKLKLPNELAYAIESRCVEFS